MAAASVDTRGGGKNRVVSPAERLADRELVLTAMAELAGRKAIITGSSRGFGAVIAEAMWREGADLLLVARTLSSLQSLRDRLMEMSHRPGQTVDVLAADLLEPTAPAAIMAAAESLWPHLDILVNNAGISGPIGIVA